MENKKKRMYVIGAFLVFLLFKPEILPNHLPMGRMVIKNSRFLAFFLGALYYMGELSAEWVKNRSPRILSENVNDSTSRDGIIKSKGWAFMRLGGILHKAWPPMKGKNGTIITPLPAIDNKNAGINVDANDEETPKDRIDPKLKEVIDKHNLPSPYYVAREPTTIEETNQAYVDWKEWKKNKDQMENTLTTIKRQMIKDTNKAVKYRETIDNNNKLGQLQRSIEKGMSENNE